MRLTWKQGESGSFALSSIVINLSTDERTCEWTIFLSTLKSYMHLIILILKYPYQQRNIIYTYNLKKTSDVRFFYFYDRVTGYVTIIRITG